MGNKTRLKLVFNVPELYLEKTRREGLFLEVWISYSGIGALEYVLGRKKGEVSSQMCEP